MPLNKLENFFLLLYIYLSPILYFGIPVPLFGGNLGKIIALVLLGLFFLRLIVSMKLPTFPNVGVMTFLLYVMLISTISLFFAIPFGTEFASSLSFNARPLPRYFVQMGSLLSMFSIFYYSYRYASKNGILICAGFYQLLASYINLPYWGISSSRPNAAFRQLGPINILRVNSFAGEPKGFASLLIIFAIPFMLLRNMIYANYIKFVGYGSIILLFLTTSASGYITFLVGLILTIYVLVAKLRQAKIKTFKTTVSLASIFLVGFIIILVFTPIQALLIQQFQRVGAATGINQGQAFLSQNVLPSGLHKRINTSDADIVHLHWINGEMISIKEVAKIEKPIVCTLHDMWAFNGAEHYDNLDNSERYVEGYKRNNRPSNYAGVDIDRWTWNRKMKYWQDVQFNFVTPSNWLADCLSRSKLFEGQEAEVIPNGLETSIFKPTKKNITREILNLPEGKKIILYGALSAENDPIKGYQKLMGAKNYHKQSDLYFVVFGNDYKRTENSKGVITQLMGRINDNVTLSLIYSAADVMVVPSIMEAFGQTASEAMACGTPVVAFNNTGSKDIVDHKENGYLAEPYSSNDLARGIEWVLADENRNKWLSKQARKKAEEQFDIEKVAKRYMKFYKKVVAKS